MFLPSHKPMPYQYRSVPQAETYYGPEYVSGEKDAYALAATVLRNGAQAGR
jgi:hypothetical protein